MTRIVREVDLGTIGLGARGCCTVGLARELNREGDGLAGFDLADVGFVDLHEDLHAGEVFGDEEEAGGVEAGDDGLADVDAAVDDDAGDGGFDGAVDEVLARAVEGGLRARDLCLGLADLGVGEG